MLDLDAREGCTLHASAVEVDEGVIAIVGRSGQGKSTLAAMLCAAGAKLITDDALRVVADDDGVCCFSGTSTLRLRPGAADLARAFAPGTAHSTADGRIGVDAEPPSLERLPLVGVLLPIPSPT